jgi:hypothetical protein
MNDEKFWSFVDKTEDCWLWIGQRTGNYGTLKRSRKTVYAHRYSWELANGAIPPAMFICHHCDNPPCVRPDHLFAGTHAENMADMRSKHRQQRGSKAYNAKLTEALATEIRGLAIAGVSRAELRARFNIGEIVLWRLLAGESYRDAGLVGEASKLVHRGRRIGSLNPQAILTEENVMDIKRRIANGEGNTSIAKDYGVSHGLISRIRLGSAWKHIEAA